MARLSGPSPKTNKCFDNEYGLDTYHHNAENSLYKNGMRNLTVEQFFIARSKLKDRRCFWKQASHLNGEANETGMLGAIDHLTGP